MPDNPLSVLFLCTHNSCRSVIAEAILNKLGAGKFKAYSAGSAPSGTINPRALHLLQTLGYDTLGFRSKSWNEFTEPDAPEFDFIFTVCDDAAGEACPVWPGHPATAHWGVADPSRLSGSEAEIAAAFEETHRILSLRIAALCALPREMEPAALTAALREIGQTEGATALAKGQS